MGTLRMLESLYASAKRVAQEGLPSAIAFHWSAPGFSILPAQSHSSVEPDDPWKTIFHLLTGSYLQSYPQPKLSQNILPKLS